MVSDVQLKVGWKLNTWLIADIERESEGMVKKFLKDLSKAPAPKQMAVGAGAGWLVGYVTMKLGKAAATAVGGSLLLLQVWCYPCFNTI